MLLYYESNWFISLFLLWMSGKIDDGYCSALWSFIWGSDVGLLKFSENKTSWGIFSSNLLLIFCSGIIAWFVFWTSFSTLSSSSFSCSKYSNINYTFWIFYFLWITWSIFIFRWRYLWIVYIIKFFNYLLSWLTILHQNYLLRLHQ